MADNWKQEMEWAVVLYRMVECKDDKTFDVVGVDSTADVKGFIRDMRDHGLVRIRKDNVCWEPTEKGHEVLKTMVAMTDLAMRFEIFGSVDLTMALPPNAEDTERPGQVLPCAWDPRFREGSGTEDLRLAMFEWLNEYLSAELDGKRLDPRRIVFLQKLGSCGFKSEGWHFWADLRLGTLFDHVQKIVDAAYKWTDMAPGNPAEAKACMLGLYEAGMAEQMKRRGQMCSHCGSALALYDQEAKEKGAPLSNCPACGASFQKQKPARAEDEFECPKCHAGIRRRQRKCHGCGAKIDFSAPAGTITAETIEETVTEVVPGWGYAYEYEPFPYFYPYDPLVDLAVFCVLADGW